LTEHDDTDFDDDGGTVNSPQVMQYYDSSASEGYDYVWQLEDSNQRNQSQFISGPHTKMPETILEL
jgi:hypothetical protein